MVYVSSTATMCKFKDRRANKFDEESWSEEAACNTWWLGRTLAEKEIVKFQKSERSDQLEIVVLCPCMMAGPVEF